MTHIYFILGAFFFIWKFIRGQGWTVASLDLIKVFSIALILFYNWLIILLKTISIGYRKISYVNQNYRWTSIKYLYCITSIQWMICWAHKIYELWCDLHLVPTNLWWILPEPIGHRKRARHLQLVAGIGISGGLCWHPASITHHGIILVKGRAQRGSMAPLPGVVFPVSATPSDSTFIG